MSGNCNSANFLAGPNRLFAKALKYSKSINAKIMHCPSPPHNGRIVKGADYSIHFTVSPHRRIHSGGKKEVSSILADQNFPRI